MKYESDQEIIHRLLKAEVERLKIKLAKAQNQTSEDPLKELIEVRSLAAEILNDSSLSMAQKSMKIAPLAKREKLARAKAKHGWSLVKHLDRESEIRSELNRIDRLCKDFEFRIQCSRAERKINGR